MIDAAKRASARTINLVVPYYGYARQERKTAPREPISAKMVADVLTTVGAHRVITIDLHAPAIQGFFNIPVDHLTALDLISDYSEIEEHSRIRSSYRRTRAGRRRRRSWPTTWTRRSPS